MNHAQVLSHGLRHNLTLRALQCSENRVNSDVIIPRFPALARLLLARCRGAIFIRTAIPRRVRRRSATRAQAAYAAGLFIRLRYKRELEPGAQFC